LNSAFQQPEADWQEKCLSEIAYSVSTGPFGSLLHKSDYVSHGVPLVNPINIVSGEIVPDTNKMVDEETQQRLSAYALQQGDIVIARRGEIGRCAVVKPHQAGWVCGTGCFFIRPKTVVHPEFIAHLIRSHDYRKELERQSSGATMANLSNTTLSNFRVSIPPLAEQHLILDQIADLQQQCRQVETIYQQKLKALAELKQSLLQKAFAGELTARAIQRAEDSAA
jgi:type I restriction enzyme S subunit